MHKPIILLAAGIILRAHGRRVQISIDELHPVGHTGKSEAAFNPSGAGVRIPRSNPNPVHASSHTVDRFAPNAPARSAPVNMEVATPSDTEKKEESARASGLALALDDGTRKSHSMAENTQFVTGFFKGISTRDAFAQLVASLYFVYRSMEEAFDATEDTDVKALDYPELRRVKSLEEDMTYYFGENWRQTVKPSSATQEYCNRVAKIAREEPRLLIAHMYTRYLGDLFGGQMMGGMARTSLKLDRNRGTRFYEFDDIPNNKQFIEAWYTKLNELDLTEKQKQDIVDEANLVFALNIKLFDSLGGGPMGVLKPVFQLSMDAVKSGLSNIWRLR